MCASVPFHVYVRLYAGFAYGNSDDDEKAEENDNRKIVPSGRRLRSHRTMSALSPEKERGHDVANAHHESIVRLLPLRSARPNFNRSDKSPRKWSWLFSNLSLSPRDVDSSLTIEEIGRGERRHVRCFRPVSRRVANQPIV